MVNKKQYELLLEIVKRDMTRQDVMDFLETDSPAEAEVYMASILDCAYPKYCSTHDENDRDVYTKAPGAFSAIEEYERNVKERERDYRLRVWALFLSGVATFASVVATIISALSLLFRFVL